MTDPTVLSPDELKAFDDEFPCDFLSSEPPYDWNFILWAFSACGMPMSFNDSNYPLTKIVARVLSYQPDTRERDEEMRRLVDDLNRWT